MDNIETPTPREKSSLSVPISIIIAGALIAGAVWFSNGTKIDTTATVGNKKPVKVTIGNLPILGEEKAKVEIVVFSDYQCPYCERFFKTVEPILRDQYVKTGKAKIAWRDFAFLGPESFLAAEAARCANDQGKFWQYHDLLFMKQNGENQGTFAKEKLKSFALELGLNQTDFDSCLDSGKYTQAVKDDSDYGKSIGVTGTPATFISGELIEGVDPSDPFTRFKAVLDKYVK
jgi:protein-disulfide isomerase